MKNSIIVFLLFFLNNNSPAQMLLDNSLELEEACILPGIIGNEQVSRPYTFKRNKSNNRTLNFTINYLPFGIYGSKTCGTWPLNAVAAFNKAVSIWSDVLENNQNIGVDACWRTNFPPGNILGGAFTQGWEVLTNQNNEDTAFPSALAEHLAGAQFNSVDINADFNANLSNWYFGLDANPPATDYDFVTVVLHELGHGLGFISIRSVNSSNCDGVFGEGCIGYRRGFGDYVPTMYDRHVDKLSDGTPITTLPNPGIEIYSLLQGTGGGLTWDEANPCYFYGGTTNSPINLPSPYQPGSSYTHFDNSVFPNELMGPSLTTGKGLHDVGLAANVMYNIGWSTPFPKLTVTSLSEPGTGSIRSVIDRSCDGEEITFQGGLTGDITLTNGQIAINHPLKITGPGSSMLSISGNNSSRIFNISNSGDLELMGLTLKNAVESINGGAIFNNGGTLTLENVILENNKQGATPKAFTVTSSSTNTVKSSVTIKN